MGNEETNDSELSKIITELWENTIIPLYGKGKIQTERHLQSYLFMLLKNRLAEKVREVWDVWVEPQFYFKDSTKKPDGEKMFKPDLVITKNHEIAGIIEVKFTPQEAIPEKNLEAAKGDIKKLVRYYKEQSHFPKREPIVYAEPFKTEFLLELDPASGAYNKMATPYIRNPGFTQYWFLGIAQYKEIKIKELLCEFTEGKLGKEFSCLIHSSSE